MGRAPTYQQLAAAFAKQVVRWEHATFVRHSLEPFIPERNQWKRGRVLKKPPKPGPLERGYAYGFDADDRLLIAREGQHEFLHVYAPELVERYMFEIHDGSLRAVAKFFHADGRLTRIEKRWTPQANTGVAAIVESLAYDSAGRLSRVALVAKSKPALNHVDEFEYDELGRLSRVVWRYPNGQGAERYRRPSKGDSLKALLPLARERLLKRIPEVLKKLGLEEPTYCVSVTCNLEEAPHLLPPRLAVGLVKDRDARIAKGGKYALDEIWSPYNQAGFDDDFQDEVYGADKPLWEKLNQPRANDAPILQMLIGVAKTLQAGGLSKLVHGTPDFVVYVVDPSSRGGQEAVKQQAPAPLRKRLRAAGLL